MPSKRDIAATITVFPSELGWMALAGAGLKVRRLVFGYETPDEALAAVVGDDLSVANVGTWNPGLVSRLQRYARGGADDFRDVLLLPAGRTPFQERVIACCRRIPLGSTSTYSALATAAGYPRAARAVGSVMSTNTVPLIVPCHRVLSASGLGGYSSRQGLTMKRRLLDLEAASKSRPRRRPTGAGQPRGVVKG